MAGSSVLSTLDLRERFHLIHMSENSKDMIANTTKKMSETGHNYIAIIEREMPAFLYACTNDNRFFLHKKFQLFTDHKTLLGSREGGAKQRARGGKPAAYKEVAGHY